jgi:hypothetical protein
VHRCQGWRIGWTVFLSVRLVNRFPLGLDWRNNHCIIVAGSYSVVTSAGLRVEFGSLGIALRSDLRLQGSFSAEQLIQDPF